MDFSFGRSPDESAQTPLASGEGEQSHKLDGWAISFHDQLRCVY